LDDHDTPDHDVGESLGDKARSLMRFAIRFDPYSPTPDDDYEKLKGELEKFDIVGLLQAELSKSRIHVALSRKIVSAIKYLDPKQRDQAVLSLIDNSELLYPIFASVLTVIKQVFADLSVSTQAAVVDRLIKLIQSGSHVVRVELIFAYTVRLLACQSSAGVQETLARIYSSPLYGPLVRRDIILAMMRLGAWPWLSDRRISFNSMSPAERRAFIIASHLLGDEGKHWRRHIARELSPLEHLVMKWADAKAAQPNWVAPL
jgi:hypothetical protein